MAEGDALCEDYLRRLTAALSEVPTRDRDLILTQIRDHLAEARAALPVQSDAGIRQILRRLGPPEEIAQAAQAEVEAPRAAKRKLRGLEALAAVFALVALGLGIAALTGAFANNQAPRAPSALPAHVAVPNVLGLDRAEAAAVLSATGFRPVLRPNGSSTAGRPGVVVGQSPPAGFEAQRKSRVSISANPDVYSGASQSPAYVPINPPTGASIVHVPNVVGLSQAEAVATLTTQGLEANVSNSNGLYVRKEMPAAGSTVPSNSEVVIDMG
jgi:PASTA domain